MTTTDPDTNRGLYGRYRVEKVNGKPVGECFVLEEHDPHAIAALRAYADSCVGDFNPLAADVAVMADRWQRGQRGRAYLREHGLQPRHTAGARGTADERGTALISELEELAARFGDQGDRFQVNGHYTEATEQFGRQFGVERALAKVREQLGLGQP